ncbi:hypothetical protein [Aliamphritea ceti]|uniref:hypothetical protein n=1 Tax=Aliamphritea ceti TaxID=1524258 RepID=UPI0021C27BB6|nr:hypothetical protein [Aliamphritea ceti]
MKGLFFLILISAGGYYVYDAQFSQSNVVPNIDVSDLQNNPASSNSILDFAAAQADGLCYEKSGMTQEGSLYEGCFKLAQSLIPGCKKSIEPEMPALVDDSEVFQRFSLKMMNCIVPLS